MRRRAPGRGREPRHSRLAWPPSSSSTPIPTTRRSPPAAPWRGSRPRVTGSSSSARPRASSARWPTASSRRRRVAHRPARRRGARRRRGPRRAARGVPRLPRLGHGRRAHHEGPRVLRDGRPRRGGRPASPRSCGRRTPRSSRCTTSAATTGTPTTSRCTGSGIRAAAMAGTPRVYESTMNRDYLIELMQSRAAEMADIERRARPRGDGPRHAGRDDHHHRRRPRLRRPEARPRWWRTRARSPTTRSSCSCRPTRSPPRSARSGSSGAVPSVPRSRTRSSPRLTRLTEALACLGPERRTAGRLDRRPGASGSEA